MMQQLNLLPDLKLEKRRIERWNRISVFVFVLVLIFFAVVSLGLLGVIVTQQRSKEEQQARYDRAKQEEATNLDRFGVEVTDETTGITTKLHINRAGKDLQDKLGTLNKLLSNRLFFKNLLSAVAANVPNGVTLDNLSADTGNLQIAGTGRDYVSIAKFANSLENYYGDVVSFGIKSEVLKEETSAIFFSRDDFGQVFLGADRTSARAFLANNPEIKKAIIEEYRKKNPEVQALFTDVKLNGISGTGATTSFNITATLSTELFNEEK